MIVLAFALGVIAVLLGAFALSRFLYFNSDGFKLAQAAQAMIEGDVDAGLDLISGRISSLPTETSCPTS